MAIDYDFIPEKISYGEKSDDVDPILGEKNVPLIMRKLSDKLAQEILSGEIFVIMDSTLKLQSTTNGIFNYKNGYRIKHFRKKTKKYENNTVILTCEAEVLTLLEDIIPQQSAYIVVDDYFKRLH